VAEFADGLGFDLADAFVGDLAYHFEGVLGTVFEAKAHLRRMDSNLARMPTHAMRLHEWAPGGSIGFRSYLGG
jgi:hypothetical protein